MNVVATETNTTIVRKLYEEVLNKRNMALLKELIADEYVGVRGLKGPAAFEEPIAALVKGFPNIQWTIISLFGEGNEVAISWKWQGTNLGPFANNAPTGKTITNEGMAIYELHDGKITAIHMQTDRLGYLQALEVLPADVVILYKRKMAATVPRFIDIFTVPAASIDPFMERVKINRRFIKTLPGFIEDTAYEHTDEQGNLVLLTIATWESEEAMTKAREAVQAEYKKQGFDMPAMLQKWHITLERGLYKETTARP